MENKSDKVHYFSHTLTISLVEFSFLTRSDVITNKAEIAISK